jgi:hypothetical protein
VICPSRLRSPLDLFEVKDEGASAIVPSRALGTPSEDRDRSNMPTQGFADPGTSLFHFRNTEQMLRLTGRGLD